MKMTLLLLQCIFSINTKVGRVTKNLLMDLQKKDIVIFS